MENSQKLNHKYEPFEMVTSDNCCALLVDLQPGLFLQVGDITPAALYNNAIALAKVLKLYNIPTIITCAAQGPKGPMGPLIPEIAELFPVEPIYRTKINSWQDPEIRKAIEATGRKKIICAGITADFCIGLPAMSMVAEGYDVRLIMDASGNDSSTVFHSTLSNFILHGVKAQGWISIACELQADWKNSTAEGLLDIYKKHNIYWSLPQTTFDTFKASLASDKTSS